MKHSVTVRSILTELAPTTAPPPVTPLGAGLFDDLADWSRAEGYYDDAAILAGFAAAWTSRGRP